MRNGFLSSNAWSSLKPAPRALYIELKRQYNGFNNGKVFLSQRDASERLNINRSTVGRYFKELIDKGFLVETQGHCLGSQGNGKAAHYALTELPLNEKPATKEFMSWGKTKPPLQNVALLAAKCSHPRRKIQPPDKKCVGKCNRF